MCMNMNSINLRQAIVKRVREKSNEELYEIIDDSVQSEERALPGLGVLFEIIWEHCGEDMRHQLVSTLNEHVPG